MSTRLQVVLPDDEAARLKEAAARERVTVSEWVRRSLRKAERRQTDGRVEERLAHIEAAAGLSFPTADMPEMLEEIERGYGTTELSG